jgi:hypothetical protein
MPANVPSLSVLRSLCLFLFLCLFLSAVEIDDVLIQVIQLRPRSRMKKFMSTSVQAATGAPSELDGVAAGLLTIGEAVPGGEEAGGSGVAVEGADGKRPLSVSAGMSRTISNDSEKLGEALAMEFRKALASPSSGALGGP